MNHVPVVFIHKGTVPAYLKKNIELAGRNNDVDLIGTDNLSHYYTGRVMRFADAFHHMNTTNEQYELFCFQRWFYLLQYMKLKGAKTVLYLDSDVALFDDATHSWDKFFKLFDFTLVHRTSGHTSFWTEEGLSRFCDFLIETYEKKKYDYEKIASHFTIRQKHGLPGGVCDMTLLEYYAYKVWDSVGEMMHILPDYSTYDHNINVPDQGFTMRAGVQGPIKDFHMDPDHNFPYVYNKKLMKHIRFRSLHFQGNAKYLVESL